MKSNNFNETKLEFAKNKFPYYLDMANQLLSNHISKFKYYLYKYRKKILDKAIKSIRNMFISL